MATARLYVSVLSAAAILLPAAAASAQSAAGVPTFTKDIAPIFQVKCEVLPSRRSDGADVARDLRRGPAVGPVHCGPHQRTPDAAVAHRQDRRHPEVQERSLAFRRSDRHDREMGGGRGAEGRSEGSSAAGTMVRRLEVAGGRQVRAAGPRDHVHALYDAGRRAGRMVEADRCRPA